MKQDIENIIKKLHNCELNGYITGMNRSVTWTDSLVAHIYRGTFNEPENGLCKKSMDENGGYSIFRNNIGRKGICKICLRNLIKEL